jgi:hypothetical protein
MLDINQCGSTRPMLQTSTWSIQLSSVGVLGGSEEEHWTHLVEHPCIGALLVYEHLLGDLYSWSVALHMCEPTCGFVGCL